MNNILKFTIFMNISEIILNLRRKTRHGTTSAGKNRVSKVYANYSMNLKITSCINTAQACNTSKVQRFCQVSEFV